MRGKLPYLKAIELLADGEWHDLEEILLKVANEVEGPRAIRRTENERIHSLPKERRSQKRKVPREQWELVEAGARSIAREVLLKGRRFEIQWLDADGNWVPRPDLAPVRTRRRVRLDPTYVYGSKDPQQWNRSRNEKHE